MLQKLEGCVYQKSKPSLRWVNCCKLDVYVRVKSCVPTVVVWVKNMAPYQFHQDRRAQNEHNNNLDTYIWVVCG